jgi:hypothetical protein
MQENMDINSAHEWHEKTSAYNAYCKAIKWYFPKVHVSPFVKRMPATWQHALDWE